MMENRARYMMLLESEVYAGDSEATFRFDVPAMGDENVPYALNLSTVKLSPRRMKREVAFSLSSLKEHRLTTTPPSLAAHPVSNLAGEFVKYVKDTDPSFAGPLLADVRNSDVLSWMRVSLPQTCHLYSSSRAILWGLGFNERDIFPASDLDIDGVEDGWCVKNTNSSQTTDLEHKALRNVRGRNFTQPLADSLRAARWEWEDRELVRLRAQKDKWTQTPAGAHVAVRRKEEAAAKRKAELAAKERRRVELEKRKKTSEKPPSDQTSELREESDDDDESRSKRSKESDDKRKELSNYLAQMRGGARDTDGFKYTEMNRWEKTLRLKFDENLDDDHDWGVVKSNYVLGHVYKTVEWSTPNSDVAALITSLNNVQFYDLEHLPLKERNVRWNLSEAGMVSASFAGVHHTVVVQGGIEISRELGLPSLAGHLQLGGSQSGTVSGIRAAGRENVTDDLMRRLHPHSKDFPLRVMAVSGGMPTGFMTGEGAQRIVGLVAETGTVQGIPVRIENSRGEQRITLEFREISGDPISFAFDGILRASFTVTY